MSSMTSRSSVATISLWYWPWMLGCAYSLLNVGNAPPGAPHEAYSPAPFQVYGFESVPGHVVRSPCDWTKFSPPK